MGYFYDNLELSNLTHYQRKKVLCDAKRNLMSVHVRQWQTRLAGLPNMKELFQTEDYVKLRQPRWARSIIARLRNGTYPINIELGRYRNIPLELRLCESCDGGFVETEAHFLCKCETYATLRSSMYDEFQRVTGLNLTTLNGDEEKLRMLLSNAKGCKCMCSYVQAADLLRNT